MTVSGQTVEIEHRRQYSINYHTVYLDTRVHTNSCDVVGGFFALRAVVLDDTHDAGSWCVFDPICKAERAALGGDALWGAWGRVQGLAVEPLVPVSQGGMMVGWYCEIHAYAKLVK